MDSGKLEHRYRILRSHLDDLGYRHPLAIEALPLVERLVSDLLHTTESVRHYKELAQKSLEECSNLEHGVEPYRIDNAKLVKECNELHLKLLHQEEDADKNKKELNRKIRKLESENSDLQFLSSQQQARIKVLEQESAQKTRKILQLQSKGVHTVITASGGKKKTLPTKPQATFELDSPLKPGKSWQEQYSSISSHVKDPYVANMVELADKRIASLNRELNFLKDEKRQQSEIIATFKNQLNNRDSEIQRLTSMLEGGRPIGAVRKDCCCSCKDMTHQLNTSTNEVKTLEMKKKDLEQQLKEAVASQHEAMTRAVMLADRNKKLEQELRDIDQMALAVEAECNSTVKENSMRVSKIQGKLDNSLMQIHDLEREVLELKRNNQELQASIEGVRNEKHHLQRKLDSALDEKKKNSDHINELKIIERGLNHEIERLVQETTLQKRRISELESMLTSRVETTPASSPKKTQPEKRPKSKSPPRTQRGDSPRKQTSPPENNVKQISKQYETRIEKIQSEKDYYFSECLRLKDQINTLTASKNNCNELRRKLNEKEQKLLELQQVNRELTKETDLLKSRIDFVPKKDTHSTMTSPCALDQASGMSLKTVIKRLERERDLAKGDIERLEEERDALRERLKIATETQVAEHARLEKTIIESEERVRKLEAERRELLSSQGSRKATISNMESQMESLQNQLFTAQSELTEQRALYNQVKVLHEQTDRALADSQGQLVQSEMELTNCRERVRQLEKDRARLDQEVALLKNEVSVVRGNLAQVDQEKDGLLISVDNKTERVAMLEQELKSKEDRLLRMEESLTEARKKLSIALEDLAARDAKSRSAEYDVESLRREIETLERARDAALNENRLLHSDLASLTEDCRRANNDLELSRQEVENLKHQLQEYVSEVRRFEDLLARKEEERTEMLDHFRSLSMEASALENNNHSLESEMQETKTQLLATSDRITDLEHQLETKDSLVHSYELQIAELSGNIARLETKIHEEANNRRRAEEDLHIMRELCTKLDSQKETLVQQVTENDLVKMQLETELARLRDEQEVLQEQLTKDRESIAALENLLSSCRQETLDQKLANKETQNEVSSLRRKISDLQEKLEKGAADLIRSQQQASEFSQQISELQRSVTNERFERARMEEERRSAMINLPTSSQAIPSAPSVTPVPSTSPPYTSFVAPGSSHFPTPFPDGQQYSMPVLGPTPMSTSFVTPESPHYRATVPAPTPFTPPLTTPSSLPASIPSAPPLTTVSGPVSSFRGPEHSNRLIQPPVFPTTSIITSPTPSAQEKRSGRASTLPQAYARTSFPGAESTTISRSSYTAPPVTSPPTSPGRLRFSLPQLDEESRAVTPTSSPEKTFRSSLRYIDRPTESAPLPPPSGSAGSNTIQRSSQRRTLASQSTVPPVPPRQRSIATSGRISTPTAPTTTVTHPSREQTVHVTFSSTGPPISSCYANYTIVRQANTTGTSTATRTTMSARDSSVPQHHSRQRTITLSDSQGSSPGRVDIEGLNFGNTDEEERASSSSDL